MPESLKQSVLWFFINQKRVKEKKRNKSFSLVSLIDCHDIERSDIRGRLTKVSYNIFRKISFKSGLEKCIKPHNWLGWEQY